jgi:hypothetical protein
MDRRAARAFAGPPIAGTQRHSWAHHCFPGNTIVFTGTLQGGVRRFVLRGASDSILNDHFLFCSEFARGFPAAALGALDYSTDFSIPAYAAGL